jgi:hypothetical protein
VPSSEEAWADTGEVVVTLAESGLGRVVVLGDTGVFANSHLSDEHNQLFAENIFSWLLLQSPVPDIKANGSDGPITISSSTNLQVTIELDAADLAGINADWWLLVDANLFGTSYWYYWHLSNAWYAGTTVSYMGPLADVSPPYEVLNYTGLYPGIYTFYLGVDTNMNGVIDVDELHYDSVTVEVVNAWPIVGIWDLIYDWDCDGSFRGTWIEFFKDYTFETGESYTGKWIQIDYQVYFYDHIGESIYYIGTMVSPNDMGGTMSHIQGMSGCWEAHRQE